MSEKNRSIEKNDRPQAADVVELLDLLREDVEIPAVVQEKAGGALAAIRRNAARASEYEPSSVHADIKETAAKNTPAKTAFLRKKHARRSGKKIWILAAALVLAFGTIQVAAAAYRRWSRSLSEGLKAEEPQQQMLQENHMASFVSQSSTDQGITVTAQQSITDNYFTHISFQVEGFSLPDGKQPDFGTVSVTVDGEDDFSWNASFYDGLVAGEDGSPQNADGTPLQRNEDGSIAVNYQMADGSLEYQITLFSPKERGYFLNKPIHVELQDLGTAERAEFQPAVQGKWAFDWTLEGSPEARICALSVPLGTTGATVTRAELSPVSMSVQYEYPRHSQTETFLDQNGQEKQGTFLIDPPQLRGVRLKDGTTYQSIYLGPGAAGYESETSTLYHTTFAIDRLLDPAQIESLLFTKPAAEISGDTIEALYYIVPLN